MGAIEVLVKLGWDLVYGPQRFETLADFTEALKVHCAKQRIHWAPADLDEALRRLTAGGLSFRRVIQPDDPSHEWPTPNSKTLDDLDELPKGDKERDWVSKQLNPDDQVTLMARYGYAWPVKG